MQNFISKINILSIKVTDTKVIVLRFDIKMSKLAGSSLNTKTNKLGKVKTAKL